MELTGAAAVGVRTEIRPWRGAGSQRKVSKTTKLMQATYIWQGDVSYIGFFIKWLNRKMRSLEPIM